MMILLLILLIPVLSKEKFWFRYIDLLQILSALQFINIPLPYNIKFFFKSISFSLFIMPFKIFHISNNNEKNVYDYYIANQSSNFFENSQFLLLTILIIFLTYLIIKFIYKKYQILKNHIIYQFYKLFRFRIFSRIFSLTIFPFSLQIFFHFFHFYQNWIQLIFVIIIFSIILSLLGYLIVIINILAFKLSPNKFSNRFGNILEEIDMQKFFGRNFIILTVINKIFFAFFLSLFYNQPSKQIFCLICLKCFCILYLIIFHPFMSKLQFFHNFLMEIIIVLILVNFYRLFNNFVLLNNEIVWEKSILYILGLIFIFVIFNFIIILIKFLQQIMNFISGFEKIISGKLISIFVNY